MGMSEAGMILGTAAYIAPEQARGRPVDKRADIWAFGVVDRPLACGLVHRAVSSVFAARATSLPRSPSRN